MQATTKTKTAVNFGGFFFLASVSHDSVLFESKHPTSMVLIWWTHDWLN